MSPVTTLTLFRLAGMIVAIGAAATAGLGGIRVANWMLEHLTWRDVAQMCAFGLAFTAGLRLTGLVWDGLERLAFRAEGRR